MSIRYEDLYDAAAVVGTEQALVGRLDSAVRGITCPSGEKRRVSGIIGRCSNTGYLVGRLAGNTLVTMDLAVLNGLVQCAPLDIEVPEGLTFSVGEMSTSGTGACSATLQYTTE
jgi:hypothetical protein